MGNIKLCFKLLAHLTPLPAIKYTDCILHVPRYYSMFYELQWFYCFFLEKDTHVFKRCFRIWEYSAPEECNLLCGASNMTHKSTQKKPGNATYGCQKGKFTHKTHFPEGWQWKIHAQSNFGAWKCTHWYTHYHCTEGLLGLKIRKRQLSLQHSVS